MAKKKKNIELTEGEKEILHIVRELGKCPECGESLRRNTSMRGWWQCAQLGAVGFRKDPNKPSCSWQAFTDIIEDKLAAQRRNGQ